MGDLRERLVAAKLAGSKAHDGAHAYLFRSNETAALVAVDEVARWLRDEAHELRRLAKDAKDHLDLERFLAQAVALEDRARSLDPTPVKPTDEEK